MLCTHEPATQVAAVHTLSSVSVHGTPFSLSGFEHCPVAGLHTPAVWHSSRGWHTTLAQRLRPAQKPSKHSSSTVAASPSSQGVPSGASTLLHSPVAWSHVPTTWHCEAALQVTLAQRSTPAHVPWLHASMTVSGLLSSHGVPVEANGLVHTPSVQVPGTWHCEMAVH